MNRTLAYNLMWLLVSACLVVACAYQIARK